MLERRTYIFATHRFQYSRVSIFNRWDPHRNIPSTLPSWTADYRQGRCRQQLRTWSLHCRKGTDWYSSGQNQKTGKHFLRGKFFWHSDLVIPRYLLPRPGPDRNKVFHGPDPGPTRSYSARTGPETIYYQPEATGSQLAKITKVDSLHVPAIKFIVKTEEAVGLKKFQLYIKNSDFHEFVKFGAISWKFDILSMTA